MIIYPKCKAAPFLQGPSIQSILRGDLPCFFWLSNRKSMNCICRGRSGGLMRFSLSSNTAKQRYLCVGTSTVPTVVGDCSIYYWSDGYLYGQNRYVRAMFSCRPHPTVGYRPAGNRDNLAARFSCKQFRKIIDTSLVSLRIVYMVILHRSHGALSESGNSSIALRCRCSFDDLPEPIYATRIQSFGCPVEGDHDSFA
jgi:hypothetical protein